MKLAIGKRYAAALLYGGTIKYTVLGYKKEGRGAYYIGKTDVLYSSITYLKEEDKIFLFGYGSIIYLTSKEIKQKTHPLTGIFK